MPLLHLTAKSEFKNRKFGEQKRSKMCGSHGTVEFLADDQIGLLIRKCVGTQMLQRAGFTAGQMGVSVCKITNINIINECFYDKRKLNL